MATNFPSALMLTGGLDSATLAYWLSARGVPLRGIFLKQNCPSSPRELRAAQAIADDLKFPLDVVQTSEIAAHFRQYWPEADIGSAGMAGRENPHLPSPPPGLPVALQIGIFHCQLLGINDLYLGLIVNQLGSAEAAAQYLDSMALATRLISNRPFAIHAPFGTMSKADVAREALNLRVPTELSWSCMAGGEDPCGTCRQCNERAAAFAAVGEADGLLLARAEAKAKATTPASRALASALGHR